MNSSGSTTPKYGLRQRYGDEIAAIIERHSTRSAPQAECLVSIDTKAALKGIVAAPAAADLQSADALTRALLMEPAWRRLRVQSLTALTGEQLAECAQYALDHFPPVKKPGIQRAELLMTLSLLAAARTWHAARRHHLLREALSLVFQVEYVRATAIIRKAHREMHGPSSRRAAEVRSPNRVDAVG